MHHADSARASGARPGAASGGTPARTTACREDPPGASAGPGPTRLPRTTDPPPAQGTITVGWAEKSPHLPSGSLARIFTL
ncbi:hypothetical protein GCM10022284_56550 [Streptomyces hundungensis]